ncbi:MAG: hypothetical protein K5745_04800 [Saccharofermentans sp.]|nr:hypothetical protein [Saccharofermentans sp.]
METVIVWHKADEHPRFNVRILISKFIQGDWQTRIAFYYPAGMTITYMKGNEEKDIVFEEEGFYLVSEPLSQDDEPKFKLVHGVSYWAYLPVPEFEGSKLREA